MLLVDLASVQLPRYRAGRCGDHFVDDPILLTLEIEHVRIAREFGSTLNLTLHLAVAGAPVGRDRPPGLLVRA